VYKNKKNANVSAGATTTGGRAQSEGGRASAWKPTAK